MSGIIFLFGHRKQRGKDTVCDMMEIELKKLNISYTRTYFAKKLKKHCAERYNLNFENMEFEDYKNSKPPHLNGLSVREVLIKEGNFARTLWSNVWVSAAYREILESKNTIGLVSDFRYNNEYTGFQQVYDGELAKRPKTTDYTLPPTLVKVHVVRKTGKYLSDGADDQLPDDGPLWDETINNDIEGNGWESNLQNQVNSLIKKYIKKEAAYAI